MNRNCIIDITKIVLAILVISIHVKIADNVYLKYLLEDGVARSAVPLFFIINGFYIEKNFFSNKTFFHYLKRLITLYFVWMLFCCPIYYSYFFSVSTINKIVFLLKGWSHLWYVSALIGGACLLYLAFKIKLDSKWLLLTCILLFCVGCTIHQYTFTRAWYVRNFLFFGFPFIGIGYLINKYQTIIFQIQYINKLLLSILLLGVFGFCVETYYQLNKNAFELKYSLLLICPSIFVFLISKRLNLTTSSLRQQISSAVYFIHPILCFVVYKYFSMDHYLNFIIVFFSSFVIGYFIYLVNLKFKCIL